MRTYSVGDIHGRRDLLDEALAWIERDAGARKHRVIFHGDYVDKGPDSRGVLERLIAGPTNPLSEWRCLAGNHEANMIEAYDCPQRASAWLTGGGLQTLFSYGLTASQIGYLPEHHMRWLRRLRLYYVDGHRVYVHAGLRPRVKLQHQTKQDLLWIRKDFLHSNYNFGRIVVHGHQPTKGQPEVRANRINIDTRAFATGRLTVAVFQGKTLVRFFQTGGSNYEQGQAA